MQSPCVLRYLELTGDNPWSSIPDAAPDGVSYRGRGPTGWPLLPASHTSATAAMMRERLRRSRGHDDLRYSSVTARLGQTLRALTFNYRTRA